jgi:hypothetical protein
MITDAPMAIHIGLMKTGTTTLQEHVFPRCQGVAYFGKPNPALARPIRAITTLDEVRWSQAQPAVIDAFRAGLAGAGPRVLLSEEEFSVGGEIDSAADRATIAGRLHDLFPAATIVVVVRNQLTALQSLYGYVRGRAPGVGEFAPWLARHSAQVVPHRGLDLFDYASLLSLYTARFPPEKVKVLFYEDMVGQWSTFLADLAVAIGLPAHAMSAIDNQRHNTRPSGLNTAYSAEHGDLVAQRFGASNSRLATVLGKDVAALGYPCQ